MAVSLGAVSHALFIAGVLAMIVAMYSGLSKCRGEVPWPWAGLANAALLLQFPLAHSALLTPRGGRLLSHLIPGLHGVTLATTTYATIASLQLLVLFIFWTPSGIVWWRAEGIALWMLTGAYAASWVLLMKAIFDAGTELQLGALGWLSLLARIKPQYPDMPTLGLFRHIRQPIYVAFALTLWTVPVWTPDQLVLAISYTAYCVLAPRLKERRFAFRYGDRFKHYRNSVPYMLPSSRAPKTLTMRNDLSIYNAVADQWWSDDVRWVRTLKNLVPGRLTWFDRHIEWPGKDVLDLGCAGGFMAEAMARRGANVTGIDPAAGAIEAARSHLQESSLDIRYDVGAGEALPYADFSFDVVVCVDVLEHVSDLNEVLAQVTRVLRPGGLFLFDTINRNTLAKLVMITLAEDILRLLPAGTHDPSMFIKPEELRIALHKAGLEPGSTVGLGPRGLTRRFDLTFGPIPMTTIIFMGIARKPHSVAASLRENVSCI
ncbi:bifunctional 2-polyprenyl-6-hydroxyphenol methylase/3-demethylubiquinol 3-O-methyltransferase UbiG [Aestuariivirga sp.]|uniref:bifunctional 2-polyprenyl-6-hydroxyphenol methylase/3-demethylubiquinol 3-O-methyltransferase UbiG n=1 Tax=Aestuariivirga sp. TaxID=2650926 RepID=UPI003BA9F245